MFFEDNWNSTYYPFKVLENNHVIKLKIYGIKLKLKLENKWFYS